MEMAQRAFRKPGVAGCGEGAQYKLIGGGEVSLRDNEDPCDGT